MPSKQENKPVSVAELAAATAVLEGMLRYMFEDLHIRWTDLTPEQQRSLLKIKKRAREVYTLLLEEKYRRAFKDPGARRLR